MLNLCLRAPMPNNLQWESVFGTDAQKDSQWKRYLNKMTVNIGQRRSTNFTFITYVSRICPAGAGNVLGDNIWWSLSADDDIIQACSFELDVNDCTFCMNILTYVGNTNLIHWNDNGSVSIAIYYLQTFMSGWKTMKGRICGVAQAGGSHE